MYITIKPHHPPMMGIQSLMGTSNSHLKCCNPNHLVTSPRIQLPLMQSEAPPLRWCGHGRVGLAGFLCRHSSRGSGHATFFVYIFLQGLKISLGQLFGCLVLVNHLEISQHFWRLLNKESATDIVCSITISVIGQFDVFFLDFISQGMFWRASQEFKAKQKWLNILN